MKRRLTSVMLLAISPNTFAMNKPAEKNQSPEKKDTSITEFYCCRDENKKTSIVCYEEDDTQNGFIHQADYTENEKKNQDTLLYAIRRMGEALERFKKSSFKKVMLTNKDGSKKWKEKIKEML